MRRRTCEEVDHLAARERGGELPIAHGVHDAHPEHVGDLATSLGCAWRAWSSDDARSLWLDDAIALGLHHVVALGLEHRRRRVRARELRQRLVDAAHRGAQHEHNLLELGAPLVERRELAVVRVDAIALQDNVILALGQRAVEFFDGDGQFVRAHVLVPLLSRLI